jgi:hypothetical protein
VVVDGNGNWSFTPNALPDGAHSFSVIVVGANGKDSAASAAIDVTVDTVCATPVITGVYDDVGTQKGYVAEGGLTDDASPRLSGTAEAGSLVSIVRTGPQNGTYSVGSAYADNSGHWVIQSNNTLAVLGKYTFKISATDVAGNKASGEEFHLTYTNSNQDSYSFTETFNKESTILFNGNSSVYKLDNFDLHVLKSGDSYYSPGINAYQPSVSKRPTSKALVFGKNTSVELDMHNPLTSISFKIGDLTTTERFTVSYLNEDGKVLHTDTFNKNNGLLTTASYTATGGEHIDAVQMSFTNTNSSASTNMTYVWVDDITGTGSSHTTQPLSASATPELQSTSLLMDDHAGESATVLSLSQVLIEEAGKPIAHADMTNHSSDVLSISLAEILSEAHPNLFINDGHQQLAVTGDAGDVVELKVADLSAHEWTDMGQVTTGGITYEVYQHAVSDVELLVQHGVELHQTV